MGRVFFSGPHMELSQFSYHPNLVQSRQQVLSGATGAQRHTYGWAEAASHRKITVFYDVIMQRYVRTLLYVFHIIKQSQQNCLQELGKRWTTRNTPRLKTRVKANLKSVVAVLVPVQIGRDKTLPLNRGKVRAAEVFLEEKFKFL